MEEKKIYVKIYNEGHHNNSFYQEEVNKQFKTQAPNYLAAWKNLKEDIMRSYETRMSRNSIDNTEVKVKSIEGNGSIGKINLNFKINKLEKDLNSNH